MESNTYYEVSILMTGRPVGSEKMFTDFDYKTKVFYKREDIEAFLKEQYGDYEREEIEPGRYSYVFENCDWSHYPVQQWEEEDQVVVNEIVATPVAL